MRTSAPRAARRSTSRSAARAVASAAALAVVLLGASCVRTTPPRPAVDPLDWVAPDARLVLWSLWPDVRELVGEEAWAAHTDGWIESEALTDLASIELGDDYVGEFVVAGIHRLGLAPDAIATVLAEVERVPSSSGLERVNVNWRAEAHWRALFARWAAAHPDRVQSELDRAWSSAHANGDLWLLAACLELTRGEVPGFDPNGFAPRDADAPSSLWSDSAAADIAADLLRFHAQEWVERGASKPVLDLLERYGVPDGVELVELADLARARRNEFDNAVIPLPHPYNLELAVLRYEQLLAQQP